MIKLDDLKGMLSVRAINCLKMRGYEYLEEVDNEAIRRLTGKKTKKEVSEFIKNYKGGNIMKNNNNDYRMVIDNETIYILSNDKTIKLTLLDREGIYVNSKIKKQVYTKTELESIEIINSFYFNNMEIWGVKDVINIGIDEPEYKELCNWYIDKEV